jgi:transcriptional regulator with XRE-family HTH domain
MNQAALGNRMAELRPNWSRSTVVKLENNNRESVSVTDLFALAVALDVPPVWLLCDPKSEEPVPIGAGMELDAWSALLWASGIQEIDDKFGRAWSEASNTIAQIQQIVMLVRRFATTRFDHRTESALAPETSDPAKNDEVERQILELMRAPLEVLQARGYVRFPLPPLVLERAGELGVDFYGEA